MASAPPQRYGQSMLTTPRLILRAWRPEDRAPFAALNADAQVMRFFPAPLSRTESDAAADRVATALDAQGWGLWAVERREQRDFIGFVGLARPRFELPGVTPCVEVGWRLARHAWGQGYAPEAGAAALDFAFAHLDLPGDEVVSFTTVANQPSRRVMEKLGLVHQPARDFLHPLTPGWSGQAHVLYAIDRAGWTTRAASAAPGPGALGG